MVWTQGPFWLRKEGLRIATLPRSIVWNDMVVFRSSTWLIRYYFKFQTFHILLYIHFLSVELGWLMCSLPRQYWWQHSNTQDTSGEGFSPEPFLCSQNSLGSRLHEHESYYSRLNQPVPVLTWINCFSVLCRGKVRSGYTNFCEVANFYRVEDAYHQPFSVWMMTREWWKHSALHLQE